MIFMLNTACVLYFHSFAKPAVGLKDLKHGFILLTLQVTSSTPVPVQSPLSAHYLLTLWAVDSDLSTFIYI